MAQPAEQSSAPAAKQRQREGVYDAIRTRLTVFLADPALHEAAFAWLLTRLLFVLLTYFGVILFGSTLHGAHPSFLHRLLPAWDNPVNHGWDTSWYIDIARRGYNWKKSVGTAPTAFFPLYSLFIRVVVVVSHRSYLVSALAVSNASFLAALIYLWRLTAWELNCEVARRTILYISVFPTALFFFAGYSESLFLFLSVACFYHMRRRDWLVAGCFGALASATRVTGVLLALPFLYEYARDRNFSLRNFDRGAMGLVLVPAGLIAFMIYLQITVHDAFAFTHLQSAWQKIFTPWLWAGTLESLRQIFIVQPRASFLQAHNVINLALGGLAFVCSVLAARKLPVAYGVYLAAFWLLTLASPAMAGGYPVPLVSLSRYVLSLFPVFLYLGIAGARREMAESYLLISVGLLSLLTLQFLTGGWVV